ncbi:MAG: ATP-dependent 6-phosphofructokinase [Planctomycetales bacterium]|nr:ATP-dependent 6-phosphofructokinase [Planctomycetales bacterium]
MTEQNSWLPEQLEVSTLGECRVDSPLTRARFPGTGRGSFVPDDMRVLYEPFFRLGEEINQLSFQRAGAREKIFFEPAKTKAAIVTCGGLCPGINNVIRTLVLELNFNYGVREVAGIRFGYQGFHPQAGLPPIELTPDHVESIHHLGGTILGSSRGHQEPGLVVDSLVNQQIDILFCIGGDGTQRGAHRIAAEIRRRQLPIAVVGIPKTIDNDIKFCFRTFGFFSAVSEAEKVIDCAHVEAKGVRGGVGLVKLMGREAGFIAAAATLASGEANFAMIPEVPFELTGPQGFLPSLRRRLEARQHAVVVVAEGAGQELLPNLADQYDASGNRQLGDIGLFLKQQITDYMRGENVPVSVKYFDPSYHIRSVPANAADSLFCERLGRKAVHAAMAGKTDILIGLWHGQLIHVPLAVSTGEKKQLSPDGELWTSVLALTGQEKWKLANGN